MNTRDAASRYSDLNVRYSDPDSAHSFLCHAAALGYNAVALTYKTFGDDLFQSKPKAERRKPADNIPNPIALHEKSLSILTPAGTPLQIYRRLSVPVQDARTFHYFANHPFCKTFDILSVCPADDKLLQQALEDISVDVIELDLSSKKGVYVKRKHARQAEGNDKFFEICYGDIFENDDTRSVFMSNCRKLITDLCPGDRGKIPEIVFLSSSVGELELLRGPKEAGYLAELLGFPAKFAGKMNSSTAWRALNGAAARKKTAKGCLQLICS